MVGDDANPEGGRGAPLDILIGEPPEPRRVNGSLGRFGFWAVLVAVAVAYVAMRARYVHGGDNGEFLVVGEEGGVPHPPGYPLYVLWLRAFSWLPFGNAAERAAIATSVSGLACVVALYIACCRWGASRPFAAAACAIFAFSPRAWTLFTEAEAFGPNAAFAAILLALAAPRRGDASSRTAACAHAGGAAHGRRRPGAEDSGCEDPGQPRTLSPVRQMVLLGFVAGLGLSNHHSAVLLAPVGLAAAGIAIARARRSSGRKPARGTMRAVAAGLGGLLAGLTPYVYLWLTARASNGRWVWGKTHTLDGLVAHVLRQEYGTFQLGPEPQASSALRQNVSLLTTVAEDFLWIPFLIALLGAAGVARRIWTAHGSERARYAGLLLTFLLTGPVFVSQFNIDPGGLGFFFVQRFYLLFEVVLALMLALGLDGLLAARVRRPPLLIALPIACAAVAAFAAKSTVQASRYPGIEWYLEDSLRSLPERAVVFGDSDLRGFGTLYLQRVEGLRRDIAFIVPAMLERAWYRDRVRAEHGLDLPASVDRLTLARAVLASGRPLFTMDPTGAWVAALAELPNYPFGTAVHLLSQHARRPTTGEVEELNRRLLHGFRIASGLDRDPSGWGKLIAADYARPWHFLAVEYEEGGDMDAARRCKALEQAILLGRMAEDRSPGLERLGSR